MARVAHYGPYTEEAQERAMKARAQGITYLFRERFDGQVEHVDAVYSDDDDVLDAYKKAGIPKHDLRSEPETREDTVTLGPAKTTTKGAVRPRGSRVAENPSTKGDDTKPAKPPEKAIETSAKK